MSCDGEEVLWPSNSVECLAWLFRHQRYGILFQLSRYIIISVSQHAACESEDKRMHLFRVWLTATRTQEGTSKNPHA
jgi:hypothetical protein